MTHLMGQENNKEDIITVEPERFKGLINSFDGVIELYETKIIIYDCNVETDIV